MHADIPTFDSWTRRHWRQEAEHLRQHLHHAGRHRGGHRPFGPFGPFGRGFPFGPGFAGGGRRAGRGDIRAAILALLAEKPMHGYQVIQELGERSGGAWRPSPGSVYPTLQQLEDEGLVQATEREGTRLFELTAAGESHLSAHGDPAPPWSGEHDVPRAAELAFELRKTVEAARQVIHTGNEEQMQRAAETLAQTRRSLYGLLAEDPDA
jgi:DNA-binding PadR family transcriptional regulator